MRSAIVPGLPAGLDSRPLRRDDVPAVLDVVAAHEAHVLGEALIDREDLEADWERPSFDGARDSAGVWAGDQLVACAEVYRARRAEVAVHPAHKGRGIGSALADWTATLAREQGGALVGQTVPDADEAARALFVGRGYRALWHSWVLAHPADRPVRPVPVPAGYRLRAFEPGRDEHAAYRVIEDAFSEWPDRDPVDEADWAAGVLRRPGFAPWQLLLAVTDEVPDEAVVGAAHLVLSDDTGWVQQLAVARPHRGRGLAQALLAAAFTAARERGAARAELSTDSRTGALDLYLHLGMEVTSAYTHWARDV